MFVPKRLLITQESKYSPRTKEIIRRAKEHNPEVEIRHIANVDAAYPADMPAAEKFEYMKESAIISERKAPFIRTFDSPGNIVEAFETICNLTFQCASNCEYCYLQNAQFLEHMLYTNLDQLEREIASSTSAHRASLTLWTMISFHLRQQLMMIPGDLSTVTDTIRESFVDRGITSDRKAIDYLYGQQLLLLESLRPSLLEDGCTGFPDRISKMSRPEIEELYSLNKDFPLWLNIGEFADPLAIDHLSGTIDFAMQLLPKYSHLRYKLRTKSGQVGDLVKYDGMDRVHVQMNFNTPHVIGKYEHGTSTLDERIAAARAIQQANGISLELIIEPILQYDGFMADYAKLMKRLMTELDPTKIIGVQVGSARYTGQLKAAATRHFAATDLFEPEQGLVEPEPADKRWRYPVEWRVKVYSYLYEICRTYAPVSFSLGAENPEVWDRMDLDRTSLINGTIHQYDHNEQEHTQFMDRIEARRTASPVVAEDVADAETEFTPSLSYRIAEKLISVMGDSIDTIKFESAERALQVVGDPGTAGSNWVSMHGLRLQSALNESKFWVPIKAVVTVRQIGTMTPITLDAQDQDSPEEYSTCHLELTDLDGFALLCVDAPIKELNCDLVKAERSKSKVTVYGAIVAVEMKPKPEYRFFLRWISEVVSDEDLVLTRPTAGEDSPERLIESHLSAAGGMIPYITEKLGRGLGMADLGRTPELHRALQFMILQALSKGKSGYSLKLHSLVIGPPGTGKSFLTKAALILNPIAEEISGVGSKITTAGLVGKVSQQGRTTVSEGGILPRNSGGVVCIQDFHGIRGNRRDEVFNLFSKCMEDGEVTDSTSAGKTMKAETSIHLDMNRKSQVDFSRPYSAAADLHIPGNVLTRFDYIEEIPPDPSRQAELAREIVGSLGAMLATADAVVDVDDWSNYLRNLIVYLRTHFNGFTASEDVSGYAEAALTTLLERTENEIGSSRFFQDFQSRVARSVNRYAMALARAYATTVITTQIVDEVFMFIEPTVRFLATYGVEVQANQAEPDVRADLLEFMRGGLSAIMPVADTAETTAFDTEEVFVKYSSRRGRTYSESPSDQHAKLQEKMSLSHQLRKHLGIRVHPTHDSRRHATVRCYYIPKHMLAPATSPDAGG